jgi:transposase
VLGVDDWAWRRGHRYGAVLIDLEKRRPVDLLPDREADTLAEWLRRHPTVEIISRDRAGAYADGARRGAPTAIQIADRFHLFANLTTAVQRLLDRLNQTLRVIEPPKIVEIRAAEVKNGTSNTVDEAGIRPMPNQHERVRQINREKRNALFDAVTAAHNRGLTKCAIANELEISRTTVRRYLRVREFPERAPRRRHSELDTYRAYLESRSAEGCHNASKLCRELQKRGYRGQRSRVKEYV